ncbi:class I SAM-dependent methyltransferase [Halobacteriovorax sp. JY17]|uniref:class I SAM-dependent methyltransferase n=1 Tax=Halobacteriovorax sp. JY17 TaxID=2014617 RepID=UPI000C4A914B|nr:class I SAM-dependent methyltransferase [Halobacteriovorax sp. JY17]PIK14684.1 MAG: hypothetical protein CES88_10120 [Halobacteriovorax sp. JY17]
MKENISYPDDGHKQTYLIEDNSFWFRSRNKIIEYVTDRFGFGSSFADVGGGNGYVSSYLKSQNKDVSIHLIEPGQRGCENAQSRGLDKIHNTTLETLNLTFDSIGLFDVIEHIEDSVSFLKKVREKLNKNGLLYITVPAYNFLWSEKDDDAGHHRRYTLKLIKEELSQSGFKTQYSSYFFGILIPFIFLLRSLPYKLGHRNPSDASNDHKSGQTGLLLEKILNLELITIKKGLKMPIGASLVIVAKAK